MKRFVLLFFLSGIPLLFSGNQWSEPIVISKGVAPDLDIDEQTGHLHILSMVHGALYTKTDSIGNILLQEIVPGSSQILGGIDYYDEGGWSFGATITSDQNDKPHVCYRIMDAFPYFSTFYTFHNGSIWSQPNQLSSNVYRGYMIRMDSDDQNRIHIALMSPLSSQIDWQGKLVYFRYFNGGRNYQNEIDVDTNPNYRLEIDASYNNQVHLITGCPRTQNGIINYYSSSDGGTPPPQLRGDIHSPECTMRNGSPDVFVDAGGNVHMCYGASVDRTVNYKPSIRYVRFENGKMVRHVRVTGLNALQTWKDGEGWGLGSVAASDDGVYVAVAYVTKDIGDLYVTLSSDGGITWPDPVKISGSVDSRPEGRNRHILRAFQNNFYLLYTLTSDITKEDPSKCQIVLRHLRNLGDQTPIAVANGPYYGREGIPIQLDGSGSTDSGVHAGIVKYSWDCNNDGIYEVTTDSVKKWYPFPDSYKGKIALKVTDWGGQTDTSSTYASMDNVSPTVEAGPDRTAKEGETISFTCQPSDVSGDLPGLNFVWAFGDGTIGSGKNITHTYADEGQYRVIVVVEDKDGGNARDSLRISVQNVAPIADAGGPYITPLSEPVRFTGNATDPGINDILSYEWDLDGDGIFEKRGKQVQIQYSRLGKVLVRLRVLDGDGGTGTDTASVTVVRDNPVLSPISNQTVQEGKAFNSIALDNYVFDPFYPDANLSWQVKGTVHLKAQIQNRILSVAPADTEWTDSETIILVVGNPKNFKDSTLVRFTITAVNDPPRWIKPVPNYSFDEDSSLSISLDSLRVRVQDVDNSISDLAFSITGNQHIEWGRDPARNVIYLITGPNWNGKENVFFRVTDKGGLGASSPCQITVRPVQDSPVDFNLIYPLLYSSVRLPDTIQFSWHRTLDVDSTGGPVYYEWILTAQNKINEPIVKQTVFDTTYQYRPDSLLSNGLYYWWVVGHTFTGNSIRSSNIGTVIIGKSGVEKSPETVPSQFRLLQNYPNPFNPSTHITCHLPGACRVRLSIVNPLGREVRVLSDGNQSAGVHTLIWDGRDQSGQKVPSGLYLCRFHAGETVLYRKMMIMQ